MIDLIATDFVANLTYIYENKGIGKKIISNTNASYNQSNTIIEKSSYFNYPGPTVDFIVDVEKFTFLVLKNRGINFEFPSIESDLSFLIKSLDVLTLEEDKDVYLYSINKLFNYFIFLFYKDIECNYRSSFTFRINNSKGMINQFMQQNIPLEIKNGQITKFYSSITDISHISTKQEYKLSFFNIINNDVHHIDIKKFTHSPTDQVPEINLSERELEILIHISNGLNAKAIAIELAISIETVNKHKKNMIKKNNVNNLIQLATKAIKKGIL
ncbi:response regulator transcription factor [Flammeovirga pectinis]|uniref:Response regulator transcription factor n=1 Tax=Flammeovirga pectinis TaxID=2494373 RepID=A0A3Q9FM86_9BACT|nr:LuxR C-terminal-related transcriptional regulator [Flammeovirga pectinis]AZQ62931.1 response regulator transcription factor [Flammeovirga pectinis]